MLGLKKDLEKSKANESGLEVELSIVKEYLRVLEFQAMVRGAATPHTCNIYLPQADKVKPSNKVEELETVRS